MDAVSDHWRCWQVRAEKLLCDIYTGKNAVRPREVYLRDGFKFPINLCARSRSIVVGRGSSRLGRRRSQFWKKTG
eukprot:6454997-Amphidinium_carterae.2